MPREQDILYFNKGYSYEEVEILRNGFYPQAEDEWFVYFQNQNMHFHHKESGFCIFILEFMEDREDGYSAYYAKANRNRNQYRFISERIDICLLSSVIEFLLGRIEAIPKCDA